ncbi:MULTISPECIES: ATP-binding protein [unclassified Paenibacillus]|uniref:sensor histidine kinase n=1 Tax=unclassified Paenibacillus TaxID=185978 RepID=UPI001AE7F82C|nr:MULTISPECIES: ATP-binding protein [unclassified Paenibacillus]MBP1156654.1 two-component system nitrate/nitrite sensor histidine kinase NarX [Paenibacillus sp. PvP091]MBP1172608.1 two-component system nitrate/nitrite sensor histidine kinase NarX [Paenibacillus sp. PvR098]MBP2438988.1 two-component system nitrate/nitrite sensor histidine kinase NarX [Paenibacillus sp. PvP052]
MNWSLRSYKILTILLPPLIIGGFEYIRHDFLLNVISMEAGNFYMTLLTLLLSYLFGTWMFGRIQTTNEKLAEEQAKRAVYEERERLAQELHDNIAQILFFMNVQLKKGRLDEARSAVSEIDHHLRQAIFNLRTAPEEGANFITRLRTWLEEWSGMSGIAVDQRISVPEDSIPPSAEVPLFSIIREAFTNIRKHSHADHAYIEFVRWDDGSGWRLRISDNGKGTDREADEQPNRYGISIMRKQAKELGAKLEIDSAPGEGLKLLVTGPLSEEKGGRKA